MKEIRVGIVGLGANTRLRHAPGLLQCPGVSIVAVCNRRPESTRAAADEYGITKAYEDWRELVNDDDVNAVVIGTWPYLHCEITLAALAAGKHVMTEARMAMNTEEARRMLQASRAHPELVTQIVPSPLGLRAHAVVKEMLADGFVGQVREVVVLGAGAGLADPSTPIHWRQVAEYSGVNMLALGILHEPMIRWLPDPVRVAAQTTIFTPQRPDAETGEMKQVGTPDSVHALAEMPDGARVLYHLSGVMHHGPDMQIQIYGTEGTIKYQFAPKDRLLAARADESELREIEVPADKEGGWRVEEDFVDAIRGVKEIEFTDFESGVRYMQFTEALAVSAAKGAVVEVASI